MALGTLISEENPWFYSKFAALGQNGIQVIYVDYRGYCLPGKVEEMLGGKKATEAAS